IRRVAAARIGGIPELQLFEERDWKEDRTFADHRALVDADGVGILLARNRTIDDSARCFAERFDQSDRWQIRRSKTNVHWNDLDRAGRDFCDHRRSDWVGSEEIISHRFHR